MTTPVSTSGQGGHVLIDSFTLYVKNWNLDLSITDEETTHSGSAGFKNSIGIIKVATGSVECDWDTANNPHTNPPNITLNATPVLKLYVGATGKYYTLTYTRITGCKVTSNATGLVTFSFTFETTGSFTMPS